MEHVNLPYIKYSHKPRVGVLKTKHKAPIIDPGTER